MAKSPAFDINGIDWMAQQNGGAFDPVLYGDYRDPQDNILNNNAFGDFFNDAFPSQDFGTPYYTGDAPPTKDPIQVIEVEKPAGPPKLGPQDDEKKFMGCDGLWFVHCVQAMAVLELLILCIRDRVRSSEKVQSGEADMDDLCSQLKSKARCSGKEAVIHEDDVDRILGPVRVEQPDFLKMFS